MLGQEEPRGAQGEANMAPDGSKMAPIWPKMVQDVSLELFWAFVLGRLGPPYLALHSFCLCFDLVLSSVCLRRAVALPLLCLSAPSVGIP